MEGPEKNFFWEGSGGVVGEDLMNQYGKSSITVEEKAWIIIWLGYVVKMKDEKKGIEGRYNK